MLLTQDIFYWHFAPYWIHHQILAMFLMLVSTGLALSSIKWRHVSIITSSHHNIFMFVCSKGESKAGQIVIDKIRILDSWNILLNCETLSCWFIGTFLCISSNYRFRSPNMLASNEKNVYARLGAILRDFRLSEGTDSFMIPRQISNKKSFKNYHQAKLKKFVFDEIAQIRFLFEKFYVHTWAVPLLKCKWLFKIQKCKIQLKMFTLKEKNV